MYHASELLKNQNLRINEVASKVGYSDPLLFSKNFTKHFGISATQYIRNFSDGYFGVVVRINKLYCILYILIDYIYIGLECFWETLLKFKH